MVNQQLLNGGALNGAGLAAWVKSATVAATVALTLTAADATRVKAGVSAPQAQATATATSIRSTPGAVTTPLARGQGYFLPTVVYAGEAGLTAHSLSLAACERFVHATVEGAATLSGYAVAESEIGEAAFPGAMTGTVDAFRIRPGASQIASAAQAAVGGVVFGQSPSLTARAVSRVEASIQLSGEGFIRHDGYVEDVLASATASIAASYLERTLAVTALLALEADAYRIRPGASTLTSVMTAVVEYRGVALLNVPLQAQASGAVAALRTKPGQVSRSAVATSSQALAGVGQAARATLSTTLTGTGTSVIDHGGRAVGDLAAGQGAAVAIRHKAGRVAATGKLTTTSIVLGRNNPSTVSGLVTARGAALGGTTYHGVTATAVGTLTATSIVLARGNPSLVYGQAGIAGTALGGVAYSQVTAATTASAMGAISASGVYRGFSATAAGALYALGQATGRARIDLNAPLSRSMIVPYEPRGLIVPAEDRTLVVPA